MRKFETAFGASQHPTWHVSASGSLVSRSDDIDGGKDAAWKREFLRRLIAGRKKQNHLRSVNQREIHRAKGARWRRVPPLRKPTRSQEANAKKNRRLAPVGMTVSICVARKRKTIEAIVRFTLTDSRGRTEFPFCEWDWDTLSGFREESHEGI
jgi:hypothetical protein